MPPVIASEKLSLLSPTCLDVFRQLHGMRPADKASQELEPKARAHADRVADDARFECYPGQPYASFSIPPQFHRRAGNNDRSGEKQGVRVCGTRGHA